MSDAKVSFSLESDTELFYEGRLVKKDTKSAYTDAQGKFEMVAWPNSKLTGDSEYRIVVPYMGINALTEVPDTGTTTLQTILSATSQASPTLCTLSGYVYDCTGMPLANISVNFSGIADTWLMSENKLVRKWKVTATTGASGHFSISLYPSAALSSAYQCQITVAYKGIDTQATIPDEATKTLQALLGATSEASPTLCKVYGYLNDLQGNALASAGVTFELVSDTYVMSENRLIRKWPVVATTDSAGYFEINLYANADLSGTSLYSVKVPAKGIYKLVTVPQQASVEFDNLCA